MDQLPLVNQSRIAPLWWLGAHGGAGESCLARVVPEWAAAEHAWPQVAPEHGPAPVVLVARSHAYGLQAAQAAATQWAAGLVPGVEVLGLVVVADAPGKLPRPLRDLQQVVAGGVPRTWSLPWIETWRLGDDPRFITNPREVRRLIDHLRDLLNTTTDAFH